MTDSVTSSLEQSERLFKELIWDPLVQAGLAAFYGVLPPWLKLWPIWPILKSLITQFSDSLYASAKLTLDLQAIAFLNETHRKAYKTAFVTLKIIAKDKGIDSDEFKRAKEAAKIALSQFVSHPK